MVSSGTGNVPDMSPDHSSRPGVTFASLGVLGPGAVPELARRAADLGFGSFWTAEATGAESFALLAAAGAAAPDLGLGSGVVPIQLRTPPLAAMAAATLQALHPERDIYLGIGVSSPAVVGRWHGAEYRADRPLDRMREYVTLVRACLSGETVDFDGDFHRVRKFRLGVRLGERKPKIVVAALGPKMLRLAGETADGVLLNYLPASHVAASVAHVRAGGGATVFAYVHAGVTDRAESKLAAQRDLFSYATVDSYARMFSDAGFTDEVSELREHFAAGDRDGAVAAISQRMVDAIDFVGDTAAVKAFVQSYADAGVDVPVLMPLPWGADRLGVVDATMRAVF
jgi:probable F420-dependent oxidoreductase